LCLSVVGESLGIELTLQVFESESIVEDVDVSSRWGVVVFDGVAFFDGCRYNETCAHGECRDEGGETHFESERMIELQLEFEGPLGSTGRR